MKQISYAAIVSVFLLLMICNTSSRIIPSHQGDSERTKPAEISQQEADFSSLIGWEECGDKDEECGERRMAAEAHLDYIYTQHHHP